MYYPKPFPHQEIVKERFKDQVSRINDLTKDMPQEKLLIHAGGVFTSAIALCLEFGIREADLLETTKAVIDAYKLQPKME